MDLNAIMQMAGQLKEQLSQAQSQAKNLRFTGESGGGLVRIVINGQHEALEVAIDPKVIDPEDPKLLEDLVRAAVNQATGQAANALQQNMGNMAQGMGVDLSAMFPGGLGGLGGDPQDPKDPK